MAGVLVMCSRGKESRAVKEALDVLARVCMDGAVCSMEHWPDHL